MGVLRQSDPHCLNRKTGIPSNRETAHFLAKIGLFCLKNANFWQKMTYFGFFSINRNFRFFGPDWPKKPNPLPPPEALTGAS
jgi:hypothetical protein